MNITASLRICLIKKDVSISELARRTEQSQSNLQNKLKRGNFSTDELGRFATAINARLEIRFIDNETGEPII